jgi:hypothetical protein
MRSILDKKNKKGQIDYPIITFMMIVFGLLLLAPIVMKIFSSIQTPMSNALGNVSSGGAIAQGNFNKVMNTAINFWDKVIIAAFVLATILLLISAFLIDTSPFWVILYIFISFMLILFAPDIIGSLDNIYNSATFATEVNALSFINTLRVHFGEFLVGIMIITGIIIYGKIALFGSRSRQ